MPLKRWEVRCAILGFVLVAAGMGGRLAKDDVVRRDAIIRAQGFAIPVTILEPVSGRPARAALVFHGLSANRGVMTALGRTLARHGVTAYVVDLSGHGDNTDPFSFENAELAAAALAAHLAGDGVVHPKRTVLIGHSMGGDIVIRLADRFPASATVAISPGPLVPMPPAFERLRIYEWPTQLPRNLLQQAGWMDLPLFEWAAQELVSRAGGARDSAEDFREGRAVAMTTIPWATHTGLVFNAHATRQVLEWCYRSWAEPVPSVLRDWRAPLRLALPLGVVLLFPAGASLLAAAVRKHRKLAIVEPRSSLWTIRSLATWAVLCVLVTCLLRFVVPLSFLRITTGSYLASTLVLASLLFFIAARRIAGVPLPARSNAVDASATCAALFGVLVVLGFGAAISGEFGDLWMNPPRWWRFALLVPLLFPYLWLEEHMLGEPDIRKRQRWVHFFLTRGMLWLAMAGAVLVLGSGEILVIVMGLVFILFSFAQRAAANAVRRRFQSAVAATTFSAILAAWFIAAVFPLH